MTKNKIVTAVLFLLFVAIIWTIVYVIANKGGSLMTPKSQTSQSIPLPSASSYNPPKEIKYDSSTDLKKELENVNPQVTDDDFQELKN